MLVMFRLCGLIAVAAFGAYAIAVVRFNARLMKEGKHGPPLGLAAYRKDSYTPEGQRLLEQMWGYIIATPFVMLGIVFVSTIVCNLFR